jgi:hypothetical protein
VTDPDNDEFNDAVGVPSLGGGVGWEGLVCDDNDVCLETEDRESNCWDSDRMRRSSVSSLIVNRNSSSHSGCCPPLQVSPVLYILPTLLRPWSPSCYLSFRTTSSQKVERGTYRLIALVLCFSSPTFTVQNGSCFPNLDLLGKFLYPRQLPIGP